MTVVISLARVYICMCVYIYMRVHSGVGQLLSVCLFFFCSSPFLSMLLLRAGRKEREGGNSMMMSILWHRAHIERKRKLKNQYRRGKGRKNVHYQFFFLFLYFIVFLSLSLSSANCMYKQ